MNLALGLAWLRHLADRLGWPGLAGIALLACAGAAEYAAVARLGDSNEALRLQAARLQARAQAGRQSAAAPERSGALLGLPGSHALAPVVAAVLEGARQRQVAIDQGEYAWQREATGRTARYRMSFPARGTYPQLRGWAADVLAGQPELALEEFDFRRESVGSDIVEARVRFALRVEERS